MEALEKSLKLARYNIQILFNINTIVAIIFILATPFFFSLIMLSYGEISRIGELYLPISGVILLTYIANMETDQGIYEISYTKFVSNVLVFILRLVLLLITASILIGSVLYYSKLQGGSFPYWEVFLGSIITTFYLGLISLTVTSISNSTPLGYMVTICFFIFEFITKGKHTGDFYTFSLLNESFDEKYNILLIIVLMIIFNAVVLYKKS